MLTTTWTPNTYQPVLASRVTYEEAAKRSFRRMLLEHHDVRARTWVIERSSRGPGALLTVHWPNEVRHAGT